jgi:hypothetical protein
MNCPKAHYIRLTFAARSYKSLERVNVEDTPAMLLHKENCRACAMLEAIPVRELQMTEMA